MAGLRQALSQIREHRQLSGLARSCHRALFHRDDGKADPGLLEEHMPRLQEIMGEQAGMFAAIVILSGLPGMTVRYRDKGIPRRVLVETMSDLEVWMRNYRRRHQAWGFSNINWLMNHMHGRLFRLGRLQYMLEPFQYKFRVFRHVRRGQVAALSEANVTYCSKGLVDGTNHFHDRDAAWTAQYEETASHYAGNPISHRGVAVRETVHLAKAEWQPALQPGDDILSVHIAEDGKLSIELCMESFVQAVEFYAQYFPDQPFQAFTCGSWLLDPQYQSLLPETSNIVRFQRLFYLIPLLSYADSTYERIFHDKNPDLARAPRDTQIRRAILDHAAAGGLMRNAAGFLLKEHLRAGFDPAF